MNETNKKILSFISVLSFFAVVGFIFGALHSPHSAIATVEHNQTASVADALWIFPETEIAAQSGYVFDISTNTPLFEKNADAQLPLASITKVAVAVLAIRHLESSQIITISPTALTVEGESGFVAGEEWRMQDLLDFTLMTSSNDGATALAEAIEARTGENIRTLLNNLAVELQLEQTYFINETGLDNSLLLSGAYGSARDMARLFAYVYSHHANDFSATAVDTHAFRALDNTMYEAENTNKALGALPGIVLGKTGFTDLAGGNLGVVIESEPGHALVIIALGSTLDERFTDVATLASHSLRTPQQ